MLKQLAVYIRDMLSKNKSPAFTIDRYKLLDIAERIEMLEQSVNDTMKENLKLKEENDKLRVGLTKLAFANIKVYPNLFDERC